MENTLGNKIFADIEKNEYLQEIFEAILYNYSLRLFNIRNKEARDFDITHALQFADLLSKSTDTQRSDYHKTWAQEIVALLSELYPDNENIQFYMGSVLTNVCNYRGLNFHPTQYKPIDAFDEAYEEYKKSLLKIPYTCEDYFFKS